MFSLSLPETHREIEREAFKKCQERYLGRLISSSYVRDLFKLDGGTLIKDYPDPVTYLAADTWVLVCQLRFIDAAGYANTYFGVQILYRECLTWILVSVPLENPVFDGITILEPG
jgi:hypothetical protein